MALALLVCLSPGTRAPLGDARGVPGGVGRLRGDCWGKAARGGDCRHIDFAGTTDVFSTRRAFLALNRGAGAGVCWGDPGRGGNCSHIDFRGTTHVFSTLSAFLALDQNSGTGACWGFGSGGGDCAHIDFAGTTEVFSTRRAFLAFNRNLGVGACWGHPDWGGDCSRVAFTRASEVSSNDIAFLVIDRGLGTLACWGWPEFAPACGNHSWLAATYTYVFAGGAIFIVRDGNAGTGVCLGPGCLGCPCASLGRATDVFAARYAFLALDRSSGNGTCWAGGPSTSCEHVRFTATTEVYTADEAFLALDRGSGSGTCWGNPATGGSCQNVSFSATVEIVAGDAAFVAVDAGPDNGTCWGDPDRGGRCPHISFERTAAVFSNRFSFLRLQRAAPRLQGPAAADTTAALRPALAAAAAVLFLVGCCSASWCYRCYRVAARRKEQAARSLELGVSIEYILDDFEGEVARAVGPNADPDFHEIAPHLLHGPAAKGYGQICPRDGEPHCSFVDALPRQHAAKATFFVSWVWSYKVGMFVDCLAQWALFKRGNRRDGVFLWVCAFCNNQFRILAARSAHGSDNLEAVFKARLWSIGSMLTMWDHWDKPTYLTRIWCIYEQYSAAAAGIESDIIMPRAATRDFRAKMGCGDPVSVFTGALAAIDSRSAKATYMEDEVKVKELITRGGGFKATDAAVRALLMEWFSKQFKQRLSESL